MMKSVFAALLAAASFSAVAASGVYVQGDAGISSLKLKESGFKLSSSEFSPRATVGYDFDNNLRAGIDYTHYKNISHTAGSVSSVEKTSVKVRSIGVSAVYDFPVSEKIKPYAGARLGINRVSSEYNETAANSSSHESYRATKTGLGALAGVGFQVSDNLTVDAGYRYNYLGKFEDVKIHSNEFSLGLRAKF